MFWLFSKWLPIDVCCKLLLDEGSLALLLGVNQVCVTGVSHVCHIDADRDKRRRVVDAHGHDSIQAKQIFLCLFDLLSQLASLTCKQFAKELFDHQCFISNLTLRYNVAVS